MHCLLFLHFSLVFSSVSLSPPGEQLMLSTFSNTYARMIKNKQSPVFLWVLLLVYLQQKRCYISYCILRLYVPLGCLQQLACGLKPLEVIQPLYSQTNDPWHSESVLQSPSFSPHFSWSEQHESRYPLLPSEVMNSFQVLGLHLGFPGGLHDTNRSRSSVELWPKNFNQNINEVLHFTIKSLNPFIGLTIRFTSGGQIFFNLWAFNLR